MAENRESRDNENGGAPPRERKPLFTRSYEKASLSRWLIPLIIILAVIFFMPQVMELVLPD